MSDPVGEALAELEKRAADWPVPGLQLAVVNAGETVFAGGFGECTASTLMHHGSCAKAYSSLLAVLLSREGLLDLDAPVREYVPELRTADPYFNDRVTTADLLSHRSGLGRHDFVWILNPGWPAEELVRRLPHLPLAAGMRARMEYSNIGYALAGLAVGRAAGANWAGLLEDRVLRPLGMTDTHVRWDDIDGQADKAKPYVLRDNMPAPTAWGRLDGIAAAGQVATTAGDAALWLLAQSSSDSPFREAVARTHRLETPVPPEMSPWPELRLHGYGLGWLVGYYRGRPALIHAGGVDGFLTQTVVLPEDGIGVTVSANVHMSDLPLPASLSLVDALLGVDDPTDWYQSSRTGDGDGDGDGAEQEKGKGAASGPTQPLGAFCGTYRHPGYGDLIVAEAGDSLTITVGEGTFTVEHRQLDTWDLTYDPLDARLSLTFVTGFEGIPSEAVVPFEAAVPDIRFTRRET